MRTGELDEARPFLEGHMFSVAAAVVVLDKDLKVRTWNSGAENMWGLRPGERRGRTIRCALSCSPLQAARNGIVLLMEEPPTQDPEQTRQRV